ncbi:unnamed protein product [Miscanthus lutarioriparius]|uniref:Retrotransposon gag domain-containing protein n=1 Tax=Miscanthus lutarioriparius TaxID=422564 RepID=A0A811Q8Q2_9POAL|nr:unnamed protein product [Miscanthus lutarioriparius]
MADLELIRLAEIRDERDDRVEALEGAVGELQGWRMKVDGNIDDIRYDLRLHIKPPATQPQQPSLTARRESAAAALHPSGSTVDWPTGHRIEMTTRERPYGSVTTIVPSPANVHRRSPPLVQSVERQLIGLDWPSFCRLIRERFCRDQHELLRRQHFHIKQTTTVQDYVDRFVDLVEHLTAYTPNPDHLSYITRFIDGLRDDIRAIVLVHVLPRWMLLVLWRFCRRKPSSRTTGRRSARLTITPSTSRRHPGELFHHHLPNVPLLLQPLLTTRSLRRNAVIHRAPGAWKTGQDKLKFEEPVKGVQQLQKHETKDKLLALKEFRKKNVLCFKCGNKWAPGHKCPQQVPLHVIEEILDALEVTEDSEEVDLEELEEELYWLWVTQFIVHHLSGVVPSNCVVG